MSKQSPVGLDIPEDVGTAEQSMEVLRAWIADGALVVALEPDAFGERAQDWGRLLSEVAEHIGRALALQGHMSQGAAEAAVRQAFSESGLIRRAGSQTRTSQGQIRGRIKH